MKKPELDNVKQYLERKGYEMQTIYKIQAPYSDRWIEVYGEPENAWYEWRVIENGKKVFDTWEKDRDKYAVFSGRQYGNPEIALRDALMVESGLPDPYK